MTDLRGDGSGDWVREDVELGLSLPPGFVPDGQSFQVQHWAPFVTLNAVHNKETAINAGWAVDEFSGPGPVLIKPSGRFRVRARISVRDVDGWPFRIGFMVTLSGYFVPA